MAQWKIVWKASPGGHAHTASFVIAETEEDARSAMVQFNVGPERIVSVAPHPVDVLAPYERPAMRCSIFGDKLAPRGDCWCVTCSATRLAQPIVDLLNRGAR